MEEVKGVNAFRAAHGPLVALMAVVCTDRGQHKRTRLGDVRWYACGLWLMTVPESRHQSFFPPEADKGDNYVFACPRCGRTPYFARTKWVGAMEGRLHPRNWSNGVSRADLDISELPF